MVRLGLAALVFGVCGCDAPSSAPKKKPSVVALSILRKFEDQTRCDFFRSLAPALDGGCIETRSCSWSPPAVSSEPCRVASTEGPGTIAVLLFASGNKEAALEVACSLCLMQGRSCTCSDRRCLVDDVFVHSLTMISKVKCGTTTIHGVGFSWGDQVRAVPDNPLWRPQDSEL